MSKTDADNLKFTLVFINSSNSSLFFGLGANFT